MKIIIPEKDILKDILQYLSYRPGYYWRQNTGSFSGSYNGKKRFVRFGKKGCGDITGVRYGIRIEIEVKREGKNPSEDQLEFGRMIVKNGGVYVVARSVDDVIKAGL